MQPITYLRESCACPREGVAPKFDGYPAHRGTGGGFMGKLTSPSPHLGKSSDIRSRKPVQAAHGYSGRRGSNRLSRFFCIVQARQAQITGLPTVVLFKRLQESRT